MSRILYEGFHRIEEVDAVMKGKVVKREKLFIYPAVAGIVIDENKRIALVKQYRPVIGRDTLELPAGILDKPHLTPLETLIEELAEECDLTMDDLLKVGPEPLHEYFMTVGSSDAKMRIYEVRVRNQGETSKLVDDVDVDSVEWLTYEEMEAHIANGDIADNKTILAYYMLPMLLEK